MSKVIQTVEELGAVLHWRRKHAQAVRSLDAGKDRETALQQCLTAADERADVLEGLLRSMTESYAVSLDAGYDRITALGGKCDSVQRMLADNPDYAKARAALKPAEGGGDEA